MVRRGYPSTFFPFTRFLCLCKKITVSKVTMFDQKKFPSKLIFPRTVDESNETSDISGNPIQNEKLAS